MGNNISTVHSLNRADVPMALFKHRLRTPNLFCIFTYGAIAGKFPHAGNVKNGTACPSGARPKSSRLLLITIECLYPFLRGDVGGIIGQQQVVVAAMGEAVDNRPEAVGLLG